MAENNSSAPLKTAEGAYPALPEPVSKQFQGNDDGWYGFMDARHEQATMRSGKWPIRELFTAEQMRAYAAQAVEAQAPTGNWINADDASRLVRDLDVALHGEEEAAPQASLCDVVGLVKEAAQRLGRPILAAQAAPSRPMDWDELPEDAKERARFNRNLGLLYGGDPRVSIATALSIWANTPSNGELGLMCAIYANEVAKMHIAAPQVAPAAVSVPEWDKARRGLAMLILGFAGRTDCTESAAEAVLDAATEPGMPLAGLRAALAATPALSVTEPGVLPEPETAIKEVMELVADVEREAADVGYGHGSQRLVNEKRAAIETKLRDLLTVPDATCGH